MKYKKNLLFILLLLLVSFDIVNAKVSMNYKEAKKQSNSYILNFDGYEKYVIQKKGIKFALKKGKLSTSDGFINGGMLNLDEFILSQDENRETYLFDGNEYFTMTEEGNNVYDISLNGNKYKLLSKDSTSSARITEFIQSSVSVSGDGTYSNPWVFDKRYLLTVKSANPDYATIMPSEKIVSSNVTSTFNMNIKNGYEYKNKDCIGNAVVNKDGNHLNISNITADTICNIFFKSKDVIVTYDSNRGSSCTPNSLIMSYNSYYDLSCTPYRNGFSFNGWYSQKNDGTKITSSSRVLNSNNHSIYAQWSPNEIVMQNQSFSKNYSNVQITVVVKGATNGSGSYEYSVVGTNSKYFTINHNEMIIKASTPSGTYNFTINVADSISGSSTFAVFTVKINPVTTTKATTKATTTTTKTTAKVTVKTTTKSCFELCRESGLNIATCNEECSAYTTKSTTKATTAKTTTKATTTKATTRTTTAALSCFELCRQSGLNVATCNSECDMVTATVTTTTKSTTKTTTKTTTKRTTTKATTTRATTTRATTKATTTKKVTTKAPTKKTTTRGLTQ